MQPENFIQLPSATEACRPLVKVNGEGIYATRPREGFLWAEGNDIRFSLAAPKIAIISMLFAKMAMQHVLLELR